MGNTVAGAQFETIIGLEIHVQLRTQTKLFCGCAPRFGAQPNAHTCPVCLGLPGTLPVLNGHAVDLATRTALALGCELNPRSRFARKNYFYPDLPKGYQISQYDQPIAEHGQFEFLHGAEAHSVRITRVHIEEDAGKLIHGSSATGAQSLVDLNRCGTPLVEIVTEPDLRDAEAAAAFLEAIRATLLAIDVTDASMQEGSLRCDANISLRPVGGDRLNPKTELKNLNSFRFLRHALRFEAGRQTDLLRRGEVPSQSTRLWDEETGASRAMRSKEDAHDYRYFPEPDLVPVQLGQERIEAARQAIPELPLARTRRISAEHGLELQTAWSLAQEPSRARYFEDLVAAGVDPAAAVNWVRGAIQAWVNDHGGDLASFPVDPDRLAGLQAAVDDGTISRNIARDVLGRMLESGAEAREIIREQGLEQVGDADALTAIVDAVLAKHPDEVESFRAGRHQVVGFFMGQVMRQTRGKANPQVVREILETRLAE